MTTSSQRASAVRIALLLFVGVVLAACDETDDGGASSACGPTKGVVARVIDGDTVELESGERIRYLLVDTPEITNGKMDCWGEQAADANRSFVEGQEVSLTYDVDCDDRFDRLLAYVSVGDRVINELMIERGHGCVLQIPPNGEDVIDLYNALESEAQAAGRGVWGACDPVTCD